MNVCYCKNEEEAELRFHPKCLYMNQPPPIDCDWLQEVVYNRIRFIFQLLEDKAIYWRAKCGTLLFEIGTAAFTECLQQKKRLLLRVIFFSSSDAIPREAFDTFRYIRVIMKTKRCLFLSMFV